MIANRRAGPVAAPSGRGGGGRSAGRGPPLSPDAKAPAGTVPGGRLDVAGLPLPARTASGTAPVRTRIGPGRGPEGYRL